MKYKFDYIEWYETSRTPLSHSLDRALRDKYYTLYTSPVLYYEKRDLRLHIKDYKNNEGLKHYEIFVVKILNENFNVSPISSYFLKREEDIQEIILDIEINFFGRS